MRAIELAETYNWWNLWLEVDSELVIKALKNPALVPWRLRNRWMNCLHIISKMNFFATHIYREGNQCADTLASLGHSAPNLFICLHVPDCIRSSYVKNKLGLPNFRFVTY